MLSRPDQVFNEICDFLGIDSVNDASLLPERRNVTAKKAHRIERRKFGVKLKDIPGTQYLPKKLSHSVVNALFSLFGRETEEIYPEMSQATRRMIIEECAPDIDWLEEFTGKDLSAWRI